MHQINVNTLRRYASSRLILCTVIAVCIGIAAIASSARAGAATSPNDPRYPTQWAPGAVRAQEAWDSYRGSTAIKVAILDTGVNGSLADLQGQMIPGYNAITPGGSTNDDFTGYGIGTLVAGIIGARTNNGVDIAGTSWSISMMPVKVCDAYCNYTYADIAEGINWAVSNGAHVIHVSLGLPTSDPLLEAAVANAIAQGRIVVAAAGNVATRIGYPAALPGVIAVGSTNSGGAVSNFSGRGSALDLVAPGESVLTLVRAGCCVTRTGTELGAAHVSGAAALLLAAGVPSSQVPGLLTGSATNIGPGGWDTDSGFGELDICKAFVNSGRACGGSTAPTSTPTRTNTPSANTPTRTNTPVNTPTRTNTPAAATHTPTRTPTRTATAVVLPPTTSQFSGRLKGKGTWDDHTFQVTPVPGRMLTARLEWDGQAEIDMQLYDPTGRWLTRGTGAPGTRVKTLQYPVSLIGTYTMRIYRLEGSQPAPYTLSVTR